MFNPLPPGLRSGPLDFGALWETTKKRTQDMKVVVWGLGYVGTVSAACLAQLGHEVVGVEPHQAKVDAINAGRSPIREPGLDALIAEVVASGRLKATQNGAGVVPTAD